MNYKQKALDHVRSVCPELMELSFGCEVEERPEPTIGAKEDLARPPKTGGFRRGKITREHLPSCKGSWVVEFGDGVGIFWEQELKIIGHPIQLHHYLTVLGNSVKGELETGFNDGATLVVYLRERGLPVTFSLTTGQPATEKDWEIMSNILGV